MACRELANALVPTDGERAVGEIVTVTSAPLAYLQHQDVTVAQRVRWLFAAADGA